MIINVTTNNQEPFLKVKLSATEVKSLREVSIALNLSWAAFVRMAINEKIEMVKSLKGDRR